MSTGELILYTTEDGGTRIRLRAEGGTVWLSQLEMADLFQTSVPNINMHVKNVLEEAELSESATIKESLIVRQEGTRQVRRGLKLYNLDMILAVGYRVRSHRGTQFRQWATTHLREFLVKGFVMDDERLKDPGGWDYFDELIQRIRDIRASEKRFYQKIRDIYATAVDYDGTMGGQAGCVPGVQRTRGPDACREGLSGSGRAPGARTLYRIRGQTARRGAPRRGRRGCRGAGATRAAA